MKDHFPKLSGSWPDFVTLLLNEFVMIVEVSPGLNLGVHDIFVSNLTNLTNLSLDQSFLITLYVVF